MKNFARSYHIVQVSRDESVILGDCTDEPFQRQLEYGRILEEFAPGSRMSIIVLLQRGDAPPVTVENVTFIPLVGRIAGRLRLWSALKALHRERPIDVITPQTVFDEAWIILLFARLSGARIVGQIHYDVFSDVAKNDLFGTSVFGWIRWKFGIRCLRYFHTLRAVGERTAKQIAEQRLSHNVKVLPVPVAAVGRREQTGKRGSRRVLFVGRMVREKNLDDWLQIAAVVARQVPDSSFLVIGDGPLRAALEARALELGLNGRITFTGYILNNRLGTVYESATVFLLTSHYEGFGRVLVEAYAYGVPVVAYACAGVEDIVADGTTGYLHPQGARGKMAESVVHLLQHPEEAQQMGAAGRARVRERFDPDNLARRWIRLLISTVLPPLPHVTMPRRRTVLRWVKIGMSSYTMLRSLEYERLEGLTLRGRTLDVGGGRRNSYYGLLRFEGEVESINIDWGIRPSVIADLNRGLPFGAAKFDNIISFNTFEHIRQDTTAVRESLRVLKPGGSFHIIVPFLYHVHGSPSDYHRHTLHWWTEFMLEHGANPATFQVEPLVWDRLSSAYSFIGHGPLGRIIRLFVTALPVVKDFFLGGAERLPFTGRNRAMVNLALGYYLHGTKLD